MGGVMGVMSKGTKMSNINENTEQFDENAEQFDGVPVLRVDPETDWLRNDAAWFENHPNRVSRAREAFPNEQDAHTQFVVLYRLPNGLLAKLYLPMLGTGATPAELALLMGSSPLADTAIQMLCGLYHLGFPPVSLRHLIARARKAHAARLREAGGARASKH
jgi:hypothetical protein